MKKFSFTQPLTPDLCGKQPKMQPPAAFLLFQNAASLHAEAIGNGTAALAERDCYRETGFVRFSEFGFPEGFEFQDYVACGGKLCRFRDEFSDDEEVYTFTVRTSSIDIGRHMNNVAYVRAFLDCFTADEVASMPVKTMEARYITACMEGEELKIFKKRTDTGFVLGARRADGKCAAFLGITLK